MNRAHLTLLASASACSRISSAQVRHFSTDCLTHCASSSLTARLAHSVSLIGFFIRSSLVVGLRAEPLRYALVEGASESFGGADRVQPKGLVFRPIDASTFAPRKRGMQRRMRFEISMKALMDQLRFQLWGRPEGPRIAPTALVKTCRTYREAVREAWRLRAVENMTQRQLACDAGIRPQLVTDYLNPDDHPHRRDLPAELIAKFGEAVGNTLVTQWVAAQARLTLLEEMQATRELA